MAGKPPPARLLLVEGADEQHVVERLCERHQYTPNFRICDKRGFPRLKPAISPEAKTSGRIALGILVDANGDPGGKWQAIAYQLRKAEIEAPASMGPAGTIIDGGDDKPRVGIWLMPDNGSKGQIEDFVRELIPSCDPIWPRAEDYIEAIPEPDRKFKPQKGLRASIHAWLAVREEPRRMGLAITAGDLDANAEPAERFMSWLRRLFG